MFKIDGFEVKLVKSKLPIMIGGLFLLLLAVPFILPSVIYQSILESRLESSTGLEFNFDGGFDVSLFPEINIVANDIGFYGQTDTKIEIVGSVKKLNLRLKFFQFLTGTISIDEFDLVSPKMTINGDFTPYLPDFLRNQLGTARKEDVRYLEVIQYFIERSVIENAKISEGIVRWNKKKNHTIKAEKINIDIVKPAEVRDFTLYSNAYVNERSVDLRIRLQRPDDFLRGFRSKLTLKLDSSPLRLEFLGSAAKRSTFVAQGDLRLDIPSLNEYCRWLSASTQCDEYQGNLLVKTDLRLRDQRLQIENASYTQNPFTFLATGAVDFKTSIPEVTGTITIPIRPIESFYTSLRDVQKFSFRNLFLDTFDANVDVKYQGVRFPSGLIIQPNVKLLLSDGRLSLTSDQFAAFDGLSNIRFRWYEGLENGYMDLRIDTNSIDLKKLQKDLGFDISMTGALKAGIEIQSEGGSILSLIETARIHGDYSVIDGSILNKDIALSLTGHNTKAFEFTELKGRVEGNRGQIYSEMIEFIAPSVDVTGSARVDLIEKEVDINFDSLISHLNKKGFVKITGPLQDMSLMTSSNGKKAPQLRDGLHSGLIPLEEKEDDTAMDHEELQIEETDLLD
ncbi:hypothetical protein MTBPR1_10199 [Candidatus Terasakiella magnetica]|uniref:AsmA-like C-terminal domain-containing protein n=1 Tax=Candidatus Terasakiella magnetica TaxID=1867952 RepID=A0A1C3RCK7_9PROT|nr:AsmA-like C-terminal region-containing protein [Candidatus Terasakiella magnetica]SCA54952.1 hypothetical protein MTBPR1_10199 [Candidatus Terasakiella magnetica]